MRHLIARLIQLCFIIGLLAMVSYASGLHNVVRMRAPAAGAWWNAHEFYLMEGAATALGLLAALRIGVRVAAEAGSIRYLVPVTLALETVLLIPLTHLCARVARIGADGGAIIVPNRMAAYVGFESGKMLDKLLIAALYFLKTMSFGFLLGLALFGAVLVGAMMSARTGSAPLDAGNTGSSAAKPEA
jgi:hypothetical protein